MKNNQKNFAWIAAIAILTLCGFSCFNNQNDSDFEKEMVRTLNLKLVNSDSIYNTTDLRVLGDTIVGHSNNNLKSPGFYFIQNLKDLSKKRLIKRNILETNNEAACITCVTPIEKVSNGCLFFLEFGRNTVIQLCNDSSATRFFDKEHDSILNVNKVRFFKNLAVLDAFNGIFIYDLNTQKLLWKQNHSINIGLMSIFNSKLIYTYAIKDRPQITTFITCIDLNTLKVIWENKFDGDLTYSATWQDSQQYYNIIENSAYQIAVPLYHSFQVIDINTGKSIISLPENNNSSFSPSFIFDQDKVFINYSVTLKCYDLSSKNKIWELPAFYLQGSYKKFLIGQSVDTKNYQIVDKSNGKILYNIQNPDLRRRNVRFIGKYILLNNKDLYE